MNKSSFWTKFFFDQNLNFVLGCRHLQRLWYVSEVDFDSKPKMWRFRRQMFAFELKNHVLKTDQFRAQSLGVCYKIGDATDDTFIKIGDSLGEEKLKLKVLNLILAFSHGFLPFSNRFLQIFIILVRR